MASYFYCIQISCVISAEARNGIKSNVTVWSSDVTTDGHTAISFVVRFSRTPITRWLERLPSSRLYMRVLFSFFVFPVGIFYPAFFPLILTLKGRRLRLSRNSAVMFVGRWDLSSCARDRQRGLRQKCTVRWRHVTRLGSNLRKILGNWKRKIAGSSG